EKGLMVGRAKAPCKLGVLKGVPTWPPNVPPAGVSWPHAGPTARRPRRPADDSTTAKDCFFISLPHEEQQGIPLVQSWPRGWRFLPLQELALSLQAKRVRGNVKLRGTF